VITSISAVTIYSDKSAIFRTIVSIYMTNSQEEIHQHRLHRDSQIIAV